MQTISRGIHSARHRSEKLKKFFSVCSTKQFPARNQKRSFPPVGQCLQRKLKSKSYTGYSESCQKCGAMPGQKCLNVTGDPAPICHISRELKAAATYRDMVRRQAALVRSSGNGGSHVA